MAALKFKKEEQEKQERNLFEEYPWYYSNLYLRMQKAADDFFKKNYKFRFMGISLEDNILFYGDEYFVNKIDINKLSSITVKISSTLISSLLDSTLGASENVFSLQKLTDIETSVIKDFTAYLYKNIEEHLNKTEVNKKVIKKSRLYNYTFYAKYGREHAGKIIITIPEYMLPEIEKPKYKNVFDINDFKNTVVKLKVGTGSTRVPLNDIKALENGDVIVLENSNINKMSVIWNNNAVEFSVNPNPSLIISVDNNGGDEMEEDVKSQNMWDSILVDVVAEFDNVKLTLGELKQISEGLVIDVGSVYDNKIKLRVENQVVATGELVILNDRYGVRIDNVKKTKEEVKRQPEPKKEPEKQPAAAKTEAAKPAPAPAKKAPAKAAAAPADKKGDENFDYSDFEIEDESI